MNALIGLGAGSMRFVTHVIVMATVLVGARSSFAQTSAPSAATPGQARKAGADARKPKAPEAELSDEAKLATVVSLYEAGKYSECAAGLVKLLAPDAEQRLRDPGIVGTARIYHAACLIGSGSPEAADEPLRQAIRSNMQMRPPDSLVFPPPVIERFLRVRQSLYDEIKQAEEERVEQARKASEQQAARERAERARVLELERLAARETLVVRNRRAIAMVPFGVGQFQNGEEGLGWVFLTSEVALAATALTSLGMQSYLQVEADRLKNPDNDSVLRTWHSLLVVSSYGLLGVAAAGIVQAQIAFVPEVREERSRSLPDRLRKYSSAGRLSAGLKVQPDAVFLGVSGKF
jgi:hypothetical protein